LTAFFLDLFVNKITQKVMRDFREIWQANWKSAGVEGTYCKEFDENGTASLFF